MNYYEEKAEEYFKRTVNIDMSNIIDEFCSLLNESSFVLDAGSGSGRDTKALMERGFKVEAIDSSKEMCRLSSSYTGLKTKNISFIDINVIEKYDAIWANASLLHVDNMLLISSIDSLLRSLKLDGYMFISFKYGKSQWKDDVGRVFNDMTYSKLGGVLEEINQNLILKMWLSYGDSSPYDKNQWINVIIKKLKDNI